MGRIGIENPLGGSMAFQEINITATEAKVQDPGEESERRDRKGGGDQAVGLFWLERHVLVDRYSINKRRRGVYQKHAAGLKGIPTEKHKQLVPYFVGSLFIFIVLPHQFSGIYTP